MAGPIFPNVPIATGVPQVLRDASNPGSDTVDQLTSDAITVSASPVDTWGIYDDGAAKVLDPDTIMAFGYDAESRIADFPIEEGGFETYDKVALPFDTRVVMTKGGSVDDRRAFLNKVDDLRSDMKLYRVVTPERTYLNVNFTRVSIDRSREQGANMITVELHLREIRQNVTATFSNSKDPASADVKSNGSVQAKDATAAQTATVAAKSATSSPGIKSAFSSISSAVNNVSTVAANLKSIPLLAGVPAQALAVQLGQQACSIVLSQKRTGMFMDLHVGGAPAALGVLVRDAAPILGAPLPGFSGDFALFDMLGARDPDFTNLGDRFQLFWTAGQ